MTSLPVDALVLGYAMSRLDRRFLAEFRFRSWQAAFQATASALGVPANSMKLLRDEFDPLHPNRRRGWHLRPMNPSRIRIAEEFESVSDDALVVFVHGLLDGRRDELADAMEVLARPANVTAAAAERLLTGRRAEDFVIEHWQAITEFPPELRLDRRLDGCGFDFGIRSRPEMAFEVKGLTRSAGTVMFTEREWQEAGRRRGDYWLVVVADLATQPRPLRFADPVALYHPVRRFRTAVTSSLEVTIRAS